MRIKIDFEIPQGTRWIVGGLLASVIVGYGVSVVRAGTVSVSTLWNSGDTLTAAALNKNFQQLQDAINAQQLTIDKLGSTVCPAGYNQDTNVANITLCKKTLGTVADEVVRVGNGNTAFWVDRYEASVWSSADGTGSQYGINAPDFPGTFPVSGQYTAPAYALSVAGVIPTAYITWFQADAACEASGKRLPSRIEWLRAARGTQDPTVASEGNNGSCVTSGAGRTGPRVTAAGSGCASTWGAQDMVGNLWEWTDEWYATLQDAAQTAIGDVITKWPSGFNDDDIWGSTGVTVQDEQRVTGLPSAAVRGGFFDSSTAGGVYELALIFAASDPHHIIGFRCVIPR